MERCQLRARFVSMTILVFGKVSYDVFHVSFLLCTYLSAHCDPECKKGSRCEPHNVCVCPKGFTGADCSEPTIGSEENTYASKISHFYSKHMITVVALQSFLVELMRQARLALQEPEVISRLSITRGSHSPVRGPTHLCKIAALPQPTECS